MPNPFTRAGRMLLNAPVAMGCNFGVCSSPGTATGDAVCPLRIWTELPMRTLLRPRTGALRLPHYGITRFQSRSWLGSQLAFQIALVFVACLTSYAQPAWPNAGTNSSHYEYRSEHDPNGIGKFFQGREIALVMGHQAADWLERPEREKEERPDLLLPALKLKPGDAIADIGAGTGYYTRRLAKIVGDKGAVYAVDIQQEMLNLLTNKMAELKIRNVKPILGTITDPKLPARSVDLILMVDVYHEFDYPYEMAQALCRALKPGGRMVFVEFRGEDASVPIKRVHKMTQEQVRKEMALQPLQWVETIDTLPWQHIIVFQTKAGAPR